MRRFLSLAAVLLFALPVGLSVTGCVTNVAAYCNNVGYGAKLTDIYAVRLPTAQSSEGLSLAWGQSAQIGSVVATNCKGTTLSVGSPTYGSLDLKNADISPSGVVCAGQWNTQSQGGVPNYTICTPSTVETRTQVTATVGGVTSNPIPVYIHPPISAVTINAPTDCFSSGAVTTSNFFVNQTSVYGPDGELIPSAASGTGSNVVGTILYAPQTSSVVTINNTNVPSTATDGTVSYGNGTATANQPGGTVITATVGGNGNNSPGTSSAAGYFYTCPPVSAALSLPGSTGTSSPSNAVEINAGNPQSLALTLTDKNGASITPTSGSNLDFASSSPQEITVSPAGLVSSTLPGTATITGICQPGSATSSSSSTSSSTSTATGQSCNPTPLNKLGTFGTGLPIVANPIAVTSPGNNSNYVWAASPHSKQFTPFDLALGTTGTPTTLPYTPNSMVLDPTGTDLYFGSYRELMIYSAASNGLLVQDTTVPGIVLAVSPSNNQVVVADQLRQVIYLYTPASGAASGSTATTSASVISTGGLATHAAYSPDGKNVYVIGPTTLYVHNISTGWSQYPLTSANATASCTLNNTNSDPFCSPDVAITEPSVAVFASGAPVIARSFCPDTTTTPVTYNPLAATVTGDAADKLAATPDGFHMLGADPTTLFDLQHSPTSDSSRLIAPVGPCPGVTGAGGTLSIQTTLAQLAFSNITPTQIDQVLAAPDSSRAFVTYMAASGSGLLPMYTPSATAGGAGTLTNIQLSGGAQVPIAGAFSKDSANFFVSTTGDNLIHEVNSASQTDTLTLNPQLTDGSGATVPAQFIATKARPTT